MFFSGVFNNVHMQYRMNEAPSLRGCVRLIVGEALRYHHDESTVPMRWVVLEVDISTAV